MDTTENILENNISELFGFNEMNDTEKAEFLDQISSVLMESALLRFTTEADEKSLTLFEESVDAGVKDENLLERLAEEFPDFSKILEEEVAAFKKEAVAVLKK